MMSTSWLRQVVFTSQSFGGTRTVRPADRSDPDTASASSGSTQKSASCWSVSLPGWA